MADVQAVPTVTLPAAAQPLAATDWMTISRDGTSLTRLLFGDLLAGLLRLVTGASFGANATTNGITGQLAYAHASDASGRYQDSSTQLRASTSSTTATRASADGAAPSAANQLVLRNNSAYKVRGFVTCFDTVAATAKEWEINALAKRGANAASTAIVGTATATSTFADTGLATAAVAVAADTTLGAFGVTVTAAAANLTRWTVRLVADEVTL